MRTLDGEYHMGSDVAIEFGQTTVYAPGDHFRGLAKMVGLAPMRNELGKCGRMKREDRDGRKKLKFPVDDCQRRGYVLGIKPAAPLHASVIRWVFFCPDSTVGEEGTTG